MDKASKAIGRVSSKLKGQYSADEVDESWENEAIVHAGWLTKQGGNYKSWKRRWFVVRGYQMLYFKDPADTRQLGVITLAYPQDKDGSLLRSVTPFEDSKRKNCFKLVGSHPDQRSYSLSADDPKECKEWMEVCKRVIYSPFGGGMFGCELWDQVVKEGRGPDRIPIIVEKCIAYLTERALKEPGIFRLPGRASRVEALRESFNKGENPDISAEPEIHAVGSLLKRYLRDLPTPLLSEERFDAFNSAAEVYQNNAEEGLMVIQQLIRDLPVANAYLLRTMCEFLAKVAEHSAENKMDTGNLAVVFSPGFLTPPPDASNVDLIKNQSTSQMVTRILIEHPKDAYALMPELDQSVWRIFKEESGRKRHSVILDHDDDSGDEGDDSPLQGSPSAKPPLPSEDVLKQVHESIATIKREDASARRPSSTGALRKKSIGASTEQQLAMDLARERGMRQHLETEIQALRQENDKLKEELATERAARVAMGGMFEQIRETESVPAAQESSQPAVSTTRKDSNPFRNL